MANNEFRKRLNHVINTMGSADAMISFEVENSIRNTNREKLSEKDVDDLVDEIMCIGDK